MFLEAAFGDEFLLEEAIDDGLQDLDEGTGDVESLSVEEAEARQALGRQYGLSLKFVGQKTDNQSPELFECKKRTAPNTVLAVARRVRQKPFQKTQPPGKNSQRGSGGGT